MIGHLSSGSGVDLVVPGYFVCAGILLYTAITAAVLGLYRARAPLYVAFAATCFFSAAITFGLASYYLADSVAGGIDALRWSTSASVLFLLAVFVFVGLYTEARGMGRAYAALAVLAVAFLVATFALPLGTRFAEVRSHGWVLMPWGESLFRLDGRVSVWNVSYRLVALGMTIWAALRLLGLHRRTGRRDAAVLAAYIVVLFGASVQGALVDLGSIKGFHTTPIAFVGLALLMSVNLGLRVHGHNLALEANAAQLRVENERRREAEARIRERAYTDALTGLPNRMSVHERLGALIEQGAESAHGAVLQCDLDHFKVVNDGLGHEVGDELLREVAARLSRCARGLGLVSRMDGDAFGIHLDPLCASEGEARAGIAALAAEAAQALARPFTLGERSFNLSSSMGFATFRAGAGTAAEAIGRAEMALHRAKKRGRNNVQAFVAPLQQEAAERFRVVEGLRRAIAEGELELNYQPLVDRHARPIGAEALMRWNSRAVGMVSPATFIPIAEETGLIHPLGEWSLREGCQQLARWRRAEVPFAGHLAINVSPWQLARPEFVERLVEIVDTSGIDPGQLTLEITESAVLIDVSEAVAKLREIRPLGVRIALDDFGTGYSSLALIKDLPLDAIKIDQSFVRNLAQGANMQLIRVVVAIGSELGLEVIAEGVETAAERDALLDLGCTHLQGYFFARPMPATQFAEWHWAQAPGVAVARSLSI